MASPAIGLDEGWEKIQEGIDKLVSRVDAGEKTIYNYLTVDEFMNLYTIVYTVCTQKKESHARELYTRYKAFFENYVHTRILPALRGKSGELLQKEVAKRCHDYNLITRILSHIFSYVDRSIACYRDKTPSLRNTAILIFQNLAYEEMKGPIIDTVLSLINEDREGNSVDPALIKDLLMVYDLGSKTLSTPYQTDFEQAFLHSSCAYYDSKIDKNRQNSEYVLQVVEYLKAEKLRVMQYLHPSTVAKLLKELSLKFEVSDRSNVSCLFSRMQLGDSNGH